MNYSMNRSDSEWTAYLNGRVAGQCVVQQSGLDGLVTFLDAFSICYPPDIWNRSEKKVSFLQEYFILDKKI